MKKYLIIIMILIRVIFAKSDTSSVTVSTLPFVFYSNSIGWVLGTFTSVKGYPQDNSFSKIGGLISTNRSKYFYFQADEVQNSLWRRQFIRPDIFLGKLGDVKEYIGAPNSKGIWPGSNESSEKQHFLLHGTDYWIELNFKNLLPFAKGENINDFKVGEAVLSNSDLSDIKIFDFGKIYFETKFIYRDMSLQNNILKTKIVATAIDYSLSNDNTNNYYFPTYGSYEKISYIKQYKAFGCDVPADIWKVDFRIFYPIVDNINKYPTVISFNFISMDTPSWNDYLMEEGKQIYKRPKLFIGPTLGGIKYLRAYKDYRYHDRAMIYYSLELRKNIEWNPFSQYEFTKKLGIDILQIASFIDVGRVAPYWRIKTLHDDMKYSLGLGIRAYMKGLVLRMDYAKGQEGGMVQMYVENPF